MFTEAKDQSINVIDITRYDQTLDNLHAQIIKWLLIECLNHTSHYYCATQNTLDIDPIPLTILPLYQTSVDIAGEIIRCDYLGAETEYHLSDPDALIKIKQLIVDGHPRDPAPNFHRLEGVRYTTSVESELHLGRNVWKHRKEQRSFVDELQKQIKE